VRDWWSNYLAKGGAGIRNRRVRGQTRDYKKMLGEALGVGAASEEVWERRKAAYTLTSRATEIWKMEVRAGRKRCRAHNAQRVAAGGSAAVTAGTGAALAAGVSGTVAKVVGIAVVVIAFVTGAAGAMWPEAEYERNRAKARLYGQLWAEMWDFATLQLPNDDPDTINAQLKQFSDRITAVGQQ
jgi:hypothetical protein